MIGKETDVEVLDHLLNTFRLLGEAYLWRMCLLATLPVVILFHVNSGLLFAIMLCSVGLYARSARLAGLLGWYMVTLTLLLYYSAPEAGHFIELLLRAPASSTSPAISTQDVLNAIPETWNSRLFWALVFGLRGGFIIGLGLGMLGRMLWGYNPRLRG